MGTKETGVWGLVAIMAIAGAAQATSTVIGTATFISGPNSGSDYNLVWDDDNNGNSLIWLDYSAPRAYWQNQKDWAAGLDAQLTYNLDPNYKVTWSSSSWRLPDAGSAPAYGFQAATQEMGHLYYDELGFVGGSSNTGVGDPDLSSCVFDNLVLGEYWSGTRGDTIDLGFLGKYDTAWAFYFKGTRDAPYYDTVYGFQDIDAISGSFFGIPLALQHYGLAVRSGEVEVAQPTAVIPEPLTMLAVAGGLAGLGSYLRRRRRS